MSFMGFLKYKLEKIPHRSIAVQGCDSYNGLSQGLRLRYSNVVVIRLEYWWKQVPCDIDIHNSGIGKGGEAAIRGQHSHLKNRAQGIQWAVRLSFAEITS